MKSTLPARVCLPLWIMVVWLVGCHLSGISQPGQINFEHFSAEKGLPDNYTRCIFEDRDGLLWMGLGGGLARYDGYHITPVQLSGLENAQATAVVTCFEDRKGRLWISLLNGGIYLSDETKSRFQVIQLEADTSELEAFNVYAFAQDRDDRFWLATNEGILLLVEDGVGFYPQTLSQFFKDTTLLYPLRPTDLLIDGLGQVWIGGGTGLYRYNPATHQWLSPKDFPSLPCSTVGQIGLDTKQRIWVSVHRKQDRLFYFHPEEERFAVFDLIPFDTAHAGCGFTFDLDGRLWATVFGDQVYGFDFSDSTLFLRTRINSNIPKERFFRNPMIDHSGKLWIPCDGYFTLDYPKGFRSYLHPYTFPQASNAVQDTKEALWVAYREQGVVRVDKKDYSTDLFSTSQKGPAHIPSDLVADIVELANGHLLFVCFDYVYTTDRLGHILVTHKIPGSNRAGFQDREGRIWIGGIGGLHLYAEKEGVLKSYSLPPILGDARNFVQSIVEDKAGMIWFASYKGLVRLDPAAGTLFQMKPEKANPHSFPALLVKDLDIDPDNILWAGTELGLVRVDPVSLAINVFGRPAGIENTIITGVVCDPQGVVWVSTLAGLSAFHPGIDRFTPYYHSDGLINYNYYERSNCLSSDGHVFFGGENGVDYFVPSGLRKNPTAPRMHLSLLKSTRQGKTIEHTQDNRPLELSYQDDLIEIDFAGLYYTNQEQVRYQYRLDPLHKDWVDLQTDHKVLLSNLKPGHYMFTARSMSPDGVYSAGDLTIPIQVEPPFFDTTAFRISISVLMAALGYLFIRRREKLIHRQEKKEAEISRKIMELEKRALQAQMNPHFIYNSMNSIQQFILMQDTEGAMKYLTRFSRILRTVLNMSSQNRIPLYEEIRLIEDYIELEQMRFPHKFTYAIRISPELNIHAIEIPPFFIQPQVENAIRHGLLNKPIPGHLLVELKKEKENVLIVVEDDGIGREAARAGRINEVGSHDSRGLAIMEERLKHLYADPHLHPFRITDLYDVGHHPAGTRVEIMLPMD